MVEADARIVHIKNMNKKELRQVVQYLLKCRSVLLSKSDNLLSQRDKLQKENDELQMIINDLSSVLEKHKIV